MRGICGLLVNIYEARHASKDRLSRYIQYPLKLSMSRGIEYSEQKQKQKKKKLKLTMRHCNPMRVSWRCKGGEPRLIGRRD